MRDLSTLGTYYLTVGIRGCGRIYMYPPSYFPKITKYLEYFFDTLLHQDGLICDDVGWWSGFKNVGNSIYNFGVGFCNTVKFIGANNYIVSSHGAQSGYVVAVVGIGVIP